MADSHAIHIDPETMRAPLTTRRLFLRPMTSADIPALTRLLSDPRIARNTSGIRYPYAAIEGWRFLRVAPAAGGGAHFIATARDNPRRIVGGCGLTWRPGETPEIGYWIASAERRRGFAGEAARALITRAFTQSPTQTVAAWTRIDNAASQRVLLRAGFSRVGRGYVFSRQFARYLPAIRFAIVRAQWQGHNCRD